MTEADLRLGGAYLKGLPVQAARALEALDPADVATCLETFEPDSVAPAVAAMRAGSALAALSLLPSDKARGILAAMDPIAAVAVLRLADSTKRAAFLEGLEGRRARRLKRVAGYPADVAGAWCDPLSPVWPAATPAGDIAEAVRRTADGPHDPLCIIRSDGGFAGCVRITDVMSAGAETPVRRLLQRDLTPILDSTPLADVTGHEGWLDFAQLPVIDLRGRLVGTLSRRRFLTGTGATPPAAAGADGDDIVISATAGAVTSLAIILEAVLSRESD